MQHRRKNAFHRGGPSTVPWKTILASSIASNKAPSTRTKPSRGNRYAFKKSRNLGGRPNWASLPISRQRLTLSKAPEISDKYSSTLCSWQIRRIHLASYMVTRSLALKFFLTIHWVFPYPRVSRKATRGCPIVRSTVFDRMLVRWMPRYWPGMYKI